MDFQFKKNVKVVCTLNIGDEVTVEGWGKKLDGKVWIVEDIKFQPGCESSVMVKINGYNGFIDSSWLDKVGAPKSNELFPIDFEVYPAH